MGRTRPVGRKVVVSSRLGGAIAVVQNAREDSSSAN